MSTFQRCTPFPLDETAAAVYQDDMNMLTMVATVRRSRDALFGSGSGASLIVASSRDSSHENPQPVGTHATCRTAEPRTAR